MRYIESKTNSKTKIMIKAIHNQVSFVLLFWFEEPKKFVDICVIFYYKKILI